jgi:LmbE family N-acetylglucosaminyl deacetylase
MASLDTLFLSPHPDDLVYSAFASITDHAGNGHAVVFFNVSRFTKWGLLPKNLVTTIRTLEEKMILRRFQLKSSFLWMNDYSTRTTPIDAFDLISKLARLRGRIRNIFCPLGIGNHPDHLAVRSTAVNYWLTFATRPRLYFYEDLPYAARIDEVDPAFESCVRALPEPKSQFSVRFHPLSADLFRRKLFFARLYVTQNDHSQLFEKHAMELGRKCGALYAERYVCSQ